MHGDTGTLLGGLAAFMSAINVIVTEIIRRRHRAITDRNRKRIHEAEDRVTQAERVASVAERTGELQLQVWKELSDQLRKEVIECHKREEEIRTELSAYRTEVVGLKNWLSGKGINWPDD